jgi:hypothetical protein
MSLSALETGWKQQMAVERARPSEKASFIPGRYRLTRKLPRMKGCTRQKYE